MLVGLEVVDAACYACYRAAMMPILERFGGAFECDFDIAKVRLGDDRINRVFMIGFPDRSTRERFFADADYRAVRERLFEPAVASVTVLGEFG
jgi:uncharacterized protein (DUF1330 family)